MKGLGFVLVALVAACVKEPVSAPYVPMCLQTSDCDQGQECRQGLCFGNPPNLAFAAEVFPPETNSALARTEIQSLQITQNGTVQVSFAPSILVTGRVVIHAHDGVSVAASVTFHRPSRIQGVADYTVTVPAIAGKQSGEIGFSARLTPNVTGETYWITVDPDATVTAANGMTAASLAPPLHQQLGALTSDTSMEVALSDAAGLKIVTGYVYDAAGRGMQGMVVTAEGRLTATSDWQICSSTGKTDSTGAFTIYVPVSWDDLLNIDVDPGPGVTAPSYRRPAVTVADPAVLTDVIALEAIRYPSYPKPAKYELPVFGSDLAGGQTPAIGATVTFTTSLATTGADTVSYKYTGPVGADGNAEVYLIPGDISANRAYLVDVVPLPKAPQASVWAQPVSVGPPNPTTGDGGVLAELELDERTYIKGQILDNGGYPAQNLTVQAQVSPYTTYALPLAMRTRIATVGMPQVITDKDGRFGVYLDPVLLSSQAETYYDFDLEPPTASLMPRWSFDRVGVAAGDDTVDLKEIVLPKPSLASGPILDEHGAPVADAELHLYVISQDTSICGSITPCTPPSRLRGLTRSDANGNVMLVLPSP
jgi:hypothetical protein